MSNTFARAVLGALCAIVAALAVTAGPAAALPPTCNPQEQVCGGEPIERTETATRKLTVTKTAGTVTSPGAIDCGATCVVTQSVSRECVDDSCSPWPSATAYTLSASGGPAGYSPSWTGCGVAGTCTVWLGDEETGGDLRTVALSWVDTTAPSTTFTPPAKVGPSNFNVTAGATDNSGSVSRYAWTVDNVAQAATGSVLSLSAAGNGNHTIGVRAYDAVDNASAVVTKTVMVDKSVAVTPGALPAVTSAATVPLTFTADADVSKRECKLDAGAYADCTSGWSGIGPATADGEHSYRVRVTDDVGNVAESAVRTTVIDRTLPVLAFTDGPTEGQQVVTRNASITFSLVEARISSVRCKLDNGAWATCSPGTAVELIGLTDGPHVLSVQAVDTAGNTRTINRSFGVEVPTTDPGTGGGDPDPEPGTGGGGTTGPVGGTTTSPGGGGTTTNPGGGTTPKPPVFAPRFTHDYVYSGKVTKFTSLAISSLPKTAKVTVACKGKGCAGKSKTLEHAGGKLNVLKALKRLKLSSGATLVIAVRGDGGAQALAKFVIRTGRRPVVSYRCAKAGAKLGACS
jgi:hypothetical protein